MTEEDFYLAFSLTSGIGPKRFLDLVKVFGSAENAWQGRKKELEKAGIGEKTFEKFEEFRKTFDFSWYHKELKNKDVSFLPQIHPDYPQSLLMLENPPIGLFIKGESSLLRMNPKMSIVGTRKMTTYGKNVTEKLATDLANEGFIIVSGLALGVDACAHTATLDAGGKTIAVLGCGVDCCYPRENEKLYTKILASGGLIISEYSLGMEPSKGSFPARNRIVAALADGILITEAARKSGSLITAQIGKDLGKKIFAVPGPITSKMSAGTSELLKTGAKFVTGVEDILQTLDTQVSRKKISQIKNLPISGDEREIILLLEKEELHIDEISKALHISITKLMVLLSGLEMKGYITAKNGVMRLSSSFFA